jgi:hypothetical protein
MKGRTCCNILVRLHKGAAGEREADRDDGAKPSDHDEGVRAVGIELRNANAKL